MIRTLDILISCIALLLALPVLVVIAILIASESSGGVFFLQTRVGRHGQEFKMIKFRTMRTDAERSGQLTVGMRDPRITRVGFFLRKLKLDELPQLWNVLVGEMSMVGPRPEVPKYVALYSVEQRSVLQVRPGITDNASLEYFDENRLLAESENPEKTYIEDVMPRKIEINMRFIRKPTIGAYLNILVRTALAILGR